MSRPPSRKANLQPPQPTVHERMERDIARHAPPTIMTDIGKVNIFSLVSQRPNRPGNHSIKEGAIIDYLCAKGEVDIGKALRSPHLPLHRILLSSEGLLMRRYTGR